MLDSLTLKNWRKRRQAIEALAQSGDQELVNALLEVLTEHRSDLDLMNGTLQLLQALQAPVIPGILQLMESPDPETRMYAALALGEFNNDERVIPSLIRALQDPEINVRFNAIEALGKLRADEAVETLLDLLQQEDFFLSFPAVVALGEIGDRRASLALLEQFSTPGLTEAVVTALGKIGDERAAAKIAAWLESGTGEAQTAAPALAHIGRMLLVSKEEKVNEQKTPGIPQEIISGIGRVGLEKLLGCLPDEEAADLPGQKQKLVTDLAFLLNWLLLTKGENRPQGEERARLIQGLIRLLAFPPAQRAAAQGLITAGSEAEPALLAWLDHYQPGEEGALAETAYAITRILGQTADPDSIPALLKAVDSGDDEWAALAAEAIRQVCARNPATARSYLSDLFHRIGQPSTAVRRALAAGIYSLHKPDDLSVFVRLLKEGNPNEREAALDLLARTGSPKALPLILERLEDPESAVRKAAIEALPFFPGEAGITALRSLVVHSDPAIRAVACRALGRCEPRLALPILYEALNDPDAWTRMYACRSIGAFGQPASLPYLKQLTHDSAPAVRITLAEALCQIGTQEAIKMAGDLLSDPEMDVQQVVGRILSCLNEQQG